MSDLKNDFGESAIAIIGMVGRFPKAKNIDEFWSNLRAGVDCISFFTDKELTAAGVEESLLTDPNYVKGRGAMDEIELFDAPFFGMTPRETEVMDPQQRIFLECAWELFEQAGYDTEKCKHLIGVFAGVSISNYLAYLYSNTTLVDRVGSFQTLISNDKDYLPTRVSYKLNLKGPSVNVQTACSTSLVAVHLACQSLLNGECDMAMAGGVSVSVPQRIGYLYQESGISSPDGHCRPFDRHAAGTVSGSGCGIVLLKRLADAITDGDNIQAVIRGSAINNDGSLKVGYTAPSIEGQAEVIALAQAVAGVSAETISYVEAHGTGTTLGDPIEVAALERAFASAKLGAGSCALGSVKSNVGHLDAAAGVAGLIKTVLALRHREIPASLHYESANPQIDFGATPFYVNARLQRWEAGERQPRRRAGVSSFGIGGTNAHVIVEEWPAAESRESKQEQWEIVTVSARTETALAAATAQLATHLEHLDQAAGNTSLRDVAYTLQVGRRAFAHRRAVVCRELQEAAAALKADSEGATGVWSGGQREVAFMFPGQGAQAVQMSRGIYQGEESYRRWVDECSAVLQAELGVELREVLYPRAGAEAAAEAKLAETMVTQPALFVVEVGLARLWQRWGVQPAALIGHSVGELAAACVAGVMEWEQGLRLVAARGRLMQSARRGAMLAVALSEAEVEHWLQGRDLSLAAVNAQKMCVVSGALEEMDQFEKELGAAGVITKRLRTSHAFHSKMVEPILDEWMEHVSRISLKPPQIPFISNVTGSWITAAEAVSPEYWRNHLRQTVRFAEGVATLLQDDERLLLEVGPGQTLRNLSQRQLRKGTKQLVLASLGAAAGYETEPLQMRECLAQLWVAGVDVDWAGFHADELPRRRVSLPTYPFERKPYWPKADRKNGKVPPPAEPLNVSAESSSAASNPQSNLIQLKEMEHDMPVLEVEATLRTARLERITSGLKEVINELTGMGSEELDPRATFLELGVDSLLLIQAIQAIEQKFKLKLTLVQLLEELSTLERLAAYMEKELPPEPAPVSTATAEHMPIAPQIESVIPTVNPQPTAPLSLPPQSAVGIEVEKILGQQFQVMSQLLDLLRRTTLPSQAETTTPVIQPVIQPPVAQAEQTTAPASSKIEPAPFVPYQPLNIGTNDGLSAHQQRSLQDFIARYTKRTQESKRRAQDYRRYLADNRNSVGFRLLWKELVYPIVGERSAGSRLWDVDGNEYIDMTMGFGVNLFGHSPRFITEALEQQLQKGVQIGPQTEMAGEVARMFCELSGLDRVVFCNSGTEAVMLALRLARAVTRRTKIALFAGSYHGTFDGVLARAGVVKNGTARSMPTAPGVLPHMVEDVIVLDYQPQSLEILRAHAHELAAVLVEPVQSRRPDIQPRELLHELRKMTAETGVALIFDEVITGFRTHPGGAQGWFGVRADLATYGKVLGGGMPIGAVAGSRAFMDVIDGGMWEFGDASYPQVEKTLFAGTFCKHPLAMAAAHAVLKHLKTEGPSLQQQLNQRASEFATRLNAVFEENNVGIRIRHFGSLCSFIISREMKYADLFFYHLCEKGVFLWEGRTCFVSTAHTQADLDFVVNAVRESISEMQQEGFFPLPANTEVAAMPASPDSSTNGHPQKTRTLPLTEAQKQLWILTQLGSNVSRAYNESVTLRLRGPLNLEALRAAVNELVERHEALRISFSPDGEWQLVAPKMTMEVPLVDFSQEPEDEREELARAWLAGEAQLAFDLVKGQLIRTHVVRLGEQHHLLVVTIHHIVIDGWSFGIVLKDLGLLYAAKCGKATRHLEPAAPFSKYANWEREQQEENTSNAQDYWCKQFADGIPELELPSDRPRPAVNSYAGARVSAVIEGSLGGALRGLSAKHGSTMMMLLLSGFSVLLHRLSNQDDIIVGIASAGQLSVGSSDLVGYCVNLLPLRSRSDNNSTFNEYLRSMKRVMLEGYSNQTYSFGKLLKQLNVPWDPRRPPLVTAAFNLERSVSGPRFADLDVEVFTNPNSASKFDIFLNVTETEHDYILDCDYNTDLFDAETVKRWLDHYRNILQGIVNNPEEKVGRLPLLSAAERSRIVEKWNETVSDYPRAACLHELFEQQAAQTPEAVAVVFDNEQLTYGELNRRANQLAHHLRKIGVGTESLVGIMLDRSVEFVVGLLGILKTGAAYVPLDPTYPPDRLRFMCQDAGIQVLVTERRQLDEHPLPDVRAICLDDNDALRAEDQHNPRSNATDDNLAYVIYTSGSTGKPKGVCVTHRAVKRLIFNTNYVELASTDRIAQASNASFDAATFEIWGALLHGAQLVGITKDTALSTTEFAAQLEEKKVNVLFLTTALFNQMARTVPTAFRSLRYLLFGGEAVDPKWVREVLIKGAPEQLLHVYGPTESTTFSTWHRVREVEAGATTIPIGKPIMNTSAYVLDRLLQPVPVGVSGELYLGGDGLARDYLNRPELTAEKFVPNPFSTEMGARLYRTGDLVRCQPDGSIEFLGRLDQQVKLRGFRIELGEIEAGLSAHPSVHEVIVIAREDVVEERRLVAYVVAKVGRQAGVSELRSFLEERLPPYMVPSSYVLIDQMPLNPNGKIDRGALPAPSQERPDLGEDFVAPSTPVEQLLARIWSEVLGVEQVGIRDNFIELGGDSILSIQAIARANQAGLRLTPAQLLQHPRIEELAALVGATSRSLPEQGSVTGRVPLTPIQHWYFEGQPIEPAHFNQAVMLEAAQPLNIEALRNAVRRVAEHHDALRLRFEPGETGWQQFNEGAWHSMPISEVDLSHVPEAEQSDAIAAAATEIQASMNLSEGRLLRVAVFKLGTNRPERLLLAAHHLAIDGISWRILLDDLQTAYLQVDRGLAIQLPLKTTSFKRWSELLNEQAQLPDLLEELPFWLAQTVADGQHLPVDNPAGANTRDSERQVSVSLTVDETRELLQTLPKIYQTEINDVLLTSLAQSLAQWIGSRRVLVNLEGHGREDFSDEVDSSRTIGWFTSIYPVVLDIGHSTELGETLRSIKEQLRLVPRRGIGYGLLRYLSGKREVVEQLRTLPQPEVSFNYLGQFDQVLRGSSLFKPARESSGVATSPLGMRRHLLEINGLVAGGRLQLTFAYSENIHRRSTIEILGDDFLVALRALINHREAPVKTHYSASDFADFNWGQSELDSIAAVIGRKSH